MMLSKIGSTNTDEDGNSNNAQLLRDIEAISKALYLQKTPQKPLISPSPIRSKSAEKPRLSESKSSLSPRTVDTRATYGNKKSSSVWNWKKPLKALAHIRSQKFNVCFFLHVHSIEGLPPGFDDMNFSVHWKRKDEVLQTRPSRVLKGIAESDETLMYNCCVYGSRSGPNHSAKYEEKIFLIYASAIGLPGVDMGKHWVDLTRLLPLTLEELEGEKSTGKWTTSFKLTGKAKGATLNVSLGFSIVRDNFIETGRNMNVSELVNLMRNRSSMEDKITGVVQTNNNGMLQRVGSVPCDSKHCSHLSSQSVDVKICDEVSRNLGLELSKSINSLYKKLNEVKLHSSEDVHTIPEHLQPLKLKTGLEFESDEDTSGDDYDSIEFTIIEKGIEMPRKEDLESEESDVQLLDGSRVETIDVEEIIKDDDIELDGKTMFHLEDNSCDNYVDVVLVDDCKHEGSSFHKKGSSMEDLELAINSFLTSQSEILESPLAIGDFLEQESFMDTKSNYKAGKSVKRSLSLDEFTESVANDFLKNLGIEHSPFGPASDGDPESPRERLLREFEEEAIASGSFLIDYDKEVKQEEFGCIASMRSDCGDPPEDFGLDMAIQATEEEHQRASQLFSRRRKAKLLEDLETETLMRQWGLNEKSFQRSPRYCSDGFGSPVELLPEEPVKLPPLGDGFGPSVQTKDGGYLRSMNPSIFRNSKHVGSLIMQVSHIVVLPAEMGSDIIEILQYLASIGIERLSQQANKLMPLEDITGKTLQQIAHDAALHVRQTSLHHESLFSTPMASHYATLEYLASLAMDKFESMLIEGLKIQSRMSEEAPSSICAKAIETMLDFEGRSADLDLSLSSEGAADLQALDPRDSGSDIGRLLDLSITLEEWLRLDAGVIGDGEQASERILNILAAHHARRMDFSHGKLTRDISWDEACGRSHGLLGNNLTLALKVLLRDPFRNYEPVGASMLALVEVERSSFHLNPKIDGITSERSNNEKEDQERIEGEDNCGNRSEEEKEEESSQGFKITEVHLSGLNAEPGKTEHWGTKRQQQYGTRWLLASGMTKSSNQSFSQSSAIVVANPRMTRKAQNDDFLWSISSHANDTESCWKDFSGFVHHIRNPNIIFPK